VPETESLVVPWVGYLRLTHLLAVAAGRHHLDTLQRILVRRDRFLQRARHLGLRPSPPVLCEVRALEAQALMGLGHRPPSPPGSAAGLGTRA
jgi:hypothetical protein